MENKLPFFAEGKLPFTPKVDVELLVRLEPEVARRVDELAREAGVDRAQLFSRALALLSVAVAGEREGERLALVDDSGRVVTEIIGVKADAG